MYKFLFSLILFALPFMAFGANYNYTCTDFTSMGGSPSATCSVSTISYTGGDGWATESSPAQVMGSATTWYAVYTDTGSGEYDVYLTNGAGSNPSHQTAGGAKTITLTADIGANSKVYIQSFSAVPFTGTITELCISDVSYADCTGGGGGGGSTDVGGYALATTTQVINNPNQDQFNGIILFMVSFWGIIWFFRRNR